MKIIRIYLLCLLPLFCFATENTIYPSRYIGIFDEFQEHKNGTLPSNEKSFTGKWEYTIPFAEEKITGSYKNGLLDGQWILSNKDGYIRFISNYYMDNYTSISYYPDGIPSLLSYGKIIVSTDSLKHEPEKVISWDPMGNKTGEIERKSHGLWQWDNWDSSLPKRRAFETKDGLVTIIAYLCDDNTLMIVFYLNNEQYFIAKKVYIYELDYDTGKISEGDMFSFGASDAIRIDMKTGVIDDNPKQKIAIFSFILLTSQDSLSYNFNYLINKE